MGTVADGKQQLLFIVIVWVQIHHFNLRPCERGDIDEVLVAQERYLRIALREISESQLIKTLKRGGLLAYKVRDEEGKQFDYSVRWPKVLMDDGKKYSTVLNPASSLILQLPKTWALKPICDDDWHESKFDVQEKDVPHLTHMKFGHVREL